MRVLTSKDGDFASYFDKIVETQAGVGASTKKQILNNTNNIDANNGKIDGQLPLEYLFLVL